MPTGKLLLQGRWRPSATAVVGMVVELTFDDGKVGDVDFRLVRQNERNETVFCPLAEQDNVLSDLTARSAKRGATLTASEDRVRVARNAQRS